MDDDWQAAVTGQTRQAISGIVVQPCRCRVAVFGRFPTATMICLVTDDATRKGLTSVFAETIPRCRQAVHPLAEILFLRPAGRFCNLVKLVARCRPDARSEGRRFGTEGFST